MKKLIIKGMGKRYFSDKIVKWYLENRRPLPWRDTTDPYRIWLSEIILQQTRVAQGLPYYQRFTESFATIHDLAAASEQDVLRLWQGLGYYTRARNLHKCANELVATRDGKFPGTYHELQKLPGIGEYTAAAIASFAFGESVAVLDGNVFRILSRIFGLDIPINSPNGKKVFSDLANDLIAGKDPGLHNQATMEFGATHCTPHNPRCEDCPFRKECVAFNQNLQNFLPVKIAGKKSRKRYFFYMVVENDHGLLMRKRVAKDIWQGLFDFALIEKTKPLKPENLIANLIKDPEHQAWLQNTEAVAISTKYVHVLTHQTIHCRFLHFKANRGFKHPDKGLSFYSPAEVTQLPKPALITRYLAEQIRR